MSSRTVYDSSKLPPPFVAELHHFWEYRSLIRLLVSRELTVRYKRSVLGAWWTLLNPLLNIAVFWFVFSTLFGRDGSDEVPFIVYLTTGILISQLFSQGVIAAGSAITGARDTLVKVYVPPEVYSLAASLSAGINFFISLAALLVIQAVSGVPIPWTFALTPLSVLAMLMFVTGLGLIVASMAVVFYDVFELVGVLTLLVTYASATFYPISILPERWHWVFTVNPVYHHITLFRGLTYGGPIEPLNIIVVAASSLMALTLGVWIFSRSWRNVVVTL